MRPSSRANNNDRLKPKDFPDGARLASPLIQTQTRTSGRRYRRDDPRDFSSAERRKDGRPEITIKRIHPGAGGSRRGSLLPLLFKYYFSERSSFDSPLISFLPPRLPRQPLCGFFSALAYAAAAFRATWPLRVWPGGARGIFPASAGPSEAPRNFPGE